VSCVGIGCKAISEKNKKWKKSKLQAGGELYIGQKEKEVDIITWRPKG